MIPIRKRQKAPTFLETLRSLWRARRHLWSLFSELGEHTTAWSYAMIATARDLYDEVLRGRSRIALLRSYLGEAEYHVEELNLKIELLERQAADAKAEVQKVRRPMGKRTASSLEPGRLHEQLTAVRAEAPPITNNAIAKYIADRDAGKPAAIPGLRVQPHEG